MQRIPNSLDVGSSPASPAKKIKWNFLKLQAYKRYERKSKKEINMDKNTYNQMRTEMWKIEELEYACNCLMESNGEDYYDYGQSETYGDTKYVSGSPKSLIDDAEYVLATFYEPDHVRNESLKYGGDVEKKECQKEIRKIKRWIKKWKPLAEGGE